MKKFTTIDGYLATLPPEEKAALSKIRRMVKASAPQATETISYGMPTFEYHGHLVAFAAFKKHLSLFTMSGAYIEQHESELANYEVSKGTIHFTADKPIPQSLVRKVVKDRMRENEARIKDKKE
jgi:uncharacterized protein YdhG (YjbR/CyaY superfamily)